VWVESKQHEMLESKCSRKSPNAGTVCSPMENLMVLAQDRHDTSTKLRDITEGALMVLKYECTFQCFWLRRVPINHA
jgi:hypothetical protein